MKWSSGIRAVQYWAPVSSIVTDKMGSLGQRPSHNLSFFLPGHRCFLLSRFSLTGPLGTLGSFTGRVDKATTVYKKLICCSIAEKKNHQKGVCTGVSVCLCTWCVLAMVRDSCVEVRTTLHADPCLPCCLRGVFVVCCCVCQAGWPMGFWRFSCLNLPSPSSSTACVPCLTFYLGSGDSNPGFHACMASTYLPSRKLKS